LKEYFGFDKTKSFFVDEDVQTYFDEFKKQKVLLYNEFNANIDVVLNAKMMKQESIFIIS
jgi:hypothetical protein